MISQTWWYLARATGITAWVLLALSVVWGLLLSTSVLKSWSTPKWLLDVHRFLGGLALVFTVLHLAGLVADSYVQLLTPTRDDSPVAKAIEKRGEGLHHIGYRVRDCGEALASMIAAGATPIDKAPRPGSRGTTVAFIHPKGSFGTLIELVQE